MAGIGRRNLLATLDAIETARIAVGQAVIMMDIALGAGDKGLIELKGTG